MSKNTQKVHSESYILHFRQSDFPFIFTDIVFRPKNYGQFDYIILQEKTTIAGYLSSKGVNQAYIFGKKLLDKKFANDVINKLKTLLSELEQNSAINQLNVLPKTDLISRWATLEILCDKIGNLYLYCEQPVVSALEKAVAAACLKKEDLVKVLRNPKYAETLKFSATQKEHLDRLILLGDLKFKIHNMFGPVFKELYSFAQSLANKFNLSLEKVLLFTNHEMIQLISKQKIPDESLINERMNGIAFVPKLDAKLLTGADYNYWKNRLEPKSVTEIKGTISYPGKVRGIVKIHLSLVSGGEIPTGTVLVAGMTNPQIVPFLKNVTAIVTDEGGLTCHAAIVSRELKIPCIVGTKIATQVLNDGDLVEVDANQGVVKILKRRNNNVF